MNRLLHNESNKGLRPLYDVKHVCAALFGLLFSAQAAYAAPIFLNNQGAYNAAAPTAVLTEDFEATGQPLNTKIFPGFSNNGVSYLGLTGTPAPHLIIASAGLTNFGAGVGTTASTVLTASGDESFVVSFASAVSAFGFDAYFNGLGPTTLNVFNGVNLLDSLTTIGTLDFIGHLGVAGVGPITSFTWVTTNGATLNTGIDNLTTAPEPASPVPVPAAVWLFGSGLLGLIGIARKKK